MIYFTAAFLLMPGINPAKKPRHSFFSLGTKQITMESLHTTLPQLKSLTEVTEKLQHEGYVNNFRANDDNLLEAIETGDILKPEQVRIVNFFRFEGMSDPNDNAILYAIETDNGLKGTLVDGYGASSDANTDEFIKAVENISKKNATANVAEKTDS